MYNKCRCDSKPDTLVQGDQSIVKHMDRSTLRKCKILYAARYYAENRNLEVGDIGYYHGIGYDGNLESGIETYAIIELEKNGYIICINPDNIQLEVL